MTTATLFNCSYSQAGVTEHIPAHRHGILGKVSEADVARLRTYLAERLQTWK